MSLGFLLKCWTFHKFGKLLIEPDPLQGLTWLHPEQILQNNPKKKEHVHTVNFLRGKLHWLLKSIQTHKHTQSVAAGPDRSAGSVCVCDVEAKVFVWSHYTVIRLITDQRLLPSKLQRKHFYLINSQLHTDYTDIQVGLLIKLCVCVCVAGDHRPGVCYAQEKLQHTEGESWLSSERLQRRRRDRGVTHTHTHTPWRRPCCDLVSKLILPSSLDFLSSHSQNRTGIKCFLKGQCRHKNGP